jgi:hypothetical protein
MFVLPAVLAVAVIVEVSSGQTPKDNPPKIANTETSPQAPDPMIRTTAIRWCIERALSKTFL